MKTKWHLYILWSVLSLCFLSSAVDTYESPFTRGKKAFKLGTPQSEPIKVSATGDGKSSHGLPAGTSPPAPGTPPSMRPQRPRTNIQSDFASLPDVSVTCSTSDFVVRVKPAFYGLGADAEELKLGSTCKSNGVLRPYGDLLFTYPLTACDAVRQSPRGYLVYKFVLHYEPSPKRFPSRAHRIDVDIECRYQRNHHVHQLTVQPTWQTSIMRKRLKGRPSDFQIELMDDSWSRPARSQVYQLGKTVNFQVSAAHVPAGGKLYISSCYATPSSGSKSSLKYIIIDKFGCMLDSKRDPGASQFISRTDKTLRFSLKAFQFTSDPDTEVSIHCKLSITSEGLGPTHKSCTYRGNRWKALTGDDSICECCDSQCVTSKPRRAMMEGFASSESVLVSDQPYPAEDDFLPVSVSRKGQATIRHHIDELHNHKNLWGSADVVVYEDEEEQSEEDEESGSILGVMPEPDLEEFGLKEWVLVEEKNESEVKDSNQFREMGSGYEAQEDFSEKEEEEEGFEGAKDSIFDTEQVIRLNQREGEVLEQMSSSKVSFPKELQPPVSEGEEENRKHADESEEDDRMTPSEEEWKNYDEDLTDKEMTWYFSWR